MVSWNFWNLRRILFALLHGRAFLLHTFSAVRLPESTRKCDTFSNIGWCSSDGSDNVETTRKDYCKAWFHLLHVWVPENEVGMWQWAFGKAATSVVLLNQGSGDGYVGIVAPSLARIFPIDSAMFDGEILCQPDAFLCSLNDVKVSNTTDQGARNCRCFRILVDRLIKSILWPSPFLMYHGQARALACMCLSWIAFFLLGYVWLMHVHARLTESSCIWDGLRARETRS